MTPNDVVQDTFIQYYTTKKQFQDEEHLKAWLLRVAINRAKDISRSFWKRNRLSIEDYADAVPFESRGKKPGFLKRLCGFLKNTGR